MNLELRTAYFIVCPSCGFKRAISHEEAGMFMVSDDKLCPGCNTFKSDETPKWSDQGRHHFAKIMTDLINQPVPMRLANPRGFGPIHER